MPGGVTNSQMTVDAKLQMISLRGFVVSAAITYPVFTYARGRVAIVAIRFTVEVALTTAKATVDVGKVGDAAAIAALVDSFEITHEAAINDKFNATLASTLVNTNVKEALGYPIVPANTLIIFTTDAAAATGQLQCEVDYFKLDETSE